MVCNILWLPLVLMVVISYNLHSYEHLGSRTLTDSWLHKQISVVKQKGQRWKHRVRTISISLKGAVDVAKKRMENIGSLRKLEQLD